MKGDKIKSIKDFTKLKDQITYLDPAEYIKLPHPYEDWVDEPYLYPEQKKKNMNW